MGLLGKKYKKIEAAPAVTEVNPSIPEIEPTRQQSIEPQEQEPKLQIVSEFQFINYKLDTIISLLENILKKAEE